jgi:hypothetical protein
LIVLIVSIWRSALIAASSPLSIDLMKTPQVALTLRVIVSIAVCRLTWGRGP